MNVFGFLSHVSMRARRNLQRQLQRLKAITLALKDWNAQPIRVTSHPSTYSRRHGDFTANIVGEFSHAVVKGTYSLNGGSPRQLRWHLPRVPKPLFVIELTDAEMRSGKNSVCLTAQCWTGRTVSHVFEFDYDDAPVDLPVKVNWADCEVDAQDGIWERFEGDLGPSLRLLSGHERYDRIVAVTGAFPIEREIFAELIFRSRKNRRPFGFGVLSLWGGRPDSRPDCGREGWNFAIAWYYSNYAAVGMEFSYRSGVEDPSWVATYRDWDLRPGERQRLRIVTSLNECNADDDPHIRQRLKWWNSAEEEPDEWMELSDIHGCRLPIAEYGVALIAHNCSVEFGNVSIRQPD